MPVLPAVPSTIVPPGRSSPFSSASVMIASAARSLTLPPGFRNSHLPRISQPVASETRFRRTSGVLPTRSTKPLRTSMLRLATIGPGSPFLERCRRRGKPSGDAMPATDQTRGAGLPRRRRPRRGPRAHRHPRRDRPAGRRPRLQAQAPGPLQLPRLHHPGAPRAGAAPRARAQPRAPHRALPARPAGHRRARRPGAGWRRPTGRMAAGDAPLPGRGGARSRSPRRPAR